MTSVATTTSPDFRRGIQSARNAEADHAPDRRRVENGQTAPAIAADRYCCRLRSCRALPQCGPPAPDLSQSVPAAGQSCCPRTRQSPPPNSHSDPYHPAVGALQVSIPRQRPERKELRVTMITQIKHPRKARSRVALLVPQALFQSVCFSGTPRHAPPPDDRPRPPPSSPSKAHAVCEAVEGQPSNPL